jgi:site-specific recombinase XerD
MGLSRNTSPPPGHTFAYEYLRSNENDLVALADILGHESLYTTRHYTRRRKEGLEEGVENVRYEKRERQEK